MRRLTRSPHLPYGLGGMSGHSGHHRHHHRHSRRRLRRWARDIGLAFVAALLVSGLSVVWIPGAARSLGERLGIVGDGPNLEELKELKRKYEESQARQSSERNR